MTAFVMLTVVTLTFAFRTAPKTAVLTDTYFTWNGTDWSLSDVSAPLGCEGENFYCAMKVPAADISEQEVNDAFNNATKPSLGITHEYGVEIVIERQGEDPLPLEATVYEKEVE